MERGSLVGRAHELDTLRGALVAAQEHRGSLVFVSGGPGLGKSALLEELARSAHDESVRVLFGRCWESGGAPAFWPWTQVLRALYRSLPRDFAEDLRAEQGSVLSQLLPELQPAGTKPPRETFGVEEARFQLLDAASRFVADAAQEKPLVLLFEDLHMADHATVQLLEFVEPVVKNGPILIVGTLRERETVDKIPDLLSLVQRSLNLPLSPLSAASCEEYLARALGHVASRDLADSIHQTTEGNPLFLVETAHVVRQQGAAAIQEIVPQKIESVIRKRSHPLSEDAQTALRTAAVLGREFKKAALAVLLPFGEKVGSLLEEACAAGLLLRLSTDLYRFEHILVRGYFYQGLPDKVRRALHSAHARNLELGLTSALSEKDSELGHHYAAGDLPAEALKALRRAAERALHQLAALDAVTLLAKGTPISAHPSVTEEERARHLLLLAQAHLLAAQLPEGKALCQQVAELARKIGSASLLAEAALTCGSVFVLAQVDPDLVSVLREALSRLPKEPSRERALVLARLAAALQPAPDPTGPFALAEEALSMARTLADPTTLLQVLRSAGSAFMDLASPERRIANNQEYASLSEELRDRPSSFRAHCWLAFDHFERRDLSKARAEIRRAEDLAALIDQPHYTWRALVFRATSLGFSGQVEPALSLLDQAEEVAQRAHDPNARRAIAIAQIWLKCMRSPTEDRRESEENLMASGGQIYERLALWGSLAKAGRTDELRRDFASEMVGQSIAAHDLVVCEELADVAIALGDKALALRLIPHLLDKDDRFGAGGMTGMTWNPPATWSLARLSILLGRKDDARSYFRRTIELLEPAEGYGFLGWTFLAVAELEAETHHHDEAARAATRAALLGAELRYPDLVSRAEALLKNLPSASSEHMRAPSEQSRPARKTPQHPLHLELHGEVWTLKFGEETLRMKDTKGLRLLATLVAEPTRQFHVLDLEAPLGPVDGGDAGELLDPVARRNYQARLTELESDLREAESFADLGRAEKLAEERDFLVQELARALGRGGTARRGGSATERARVNVQRRLKDAVRRLSEHSSVAGRHVMRSLRTGTYCSYEP